MNLISRFCLLGIILGTLTTPALAAEQLEISLGGLSNDPLVDFSPPRLGSGDSVSTTPTGLLIKQSADRPGSTEHWNTGFKVLVSGKGDFEATLGVQLIRLEEPKQGWGQGLLFAVALDDEKQSVLQLGILSAPGKGTRLRAEHIGRNVPRPTRVYKEAAFNEGTLRISRSGDEAVFTVESSGETLELLRIGCSKADVRNISVWCTRQDKGNTRTEVLLKKLLIQADSFFAFQQPRRSWWNLWYLFIGTNVLVIVGLLIVNARRMARSQK